MAGVEENLPVKATYLAFQSGHADGEPDLKVLLFAKTPQPHAYWLAILDKTPEGEETLLLEGLRSALNAPSLRFQRAQILDRSSHEDSDVFRVLAVSATTNITDSAASMQTCVRARQHDAIRLWERENAEMEVILLPSAQQYRAHTLRSHPEDSNPNSNSTSVSTSASPIGLAVFDMDSTLIQQEVIDELARRVGRYDEVSAITEAAMRGEEPYASDFAASLRARVALLRGVPVSVWEDLRREVISFTPGARELISALRARGWRTAVLSGGFVPLANWVKDQLGLDFAAANVLLDDPETGLLMGELARSVPIVDGARKAVLLQELAEQFGVSIERTVAVGDGSNDLPMMRVAGLGIAFNAKPKVQAAAPARLNSESLRDVLYILGYSEDDIMQSRSSKWRAGS